MTETKNLKARREKPYALQARKGKCLILCDHAENFVPSDCPPIAQHLLDTHFGWDIGALAVARCLSEALDASLVYATFSRLLIDPNRSLLARDLIRSDLGPDGNETLESHARSDRLSERLGRFFFPYHRAIDRFLNERAETDPITLLASVHTFTPNLDGEERPWHIGLFYEDNERDKACAHFLIESLRKDRALCVGDNQPYGPEGGKNYTLRRHAKTREIPSLGIEIRNDLLSHEQSCRAWTDRLSPLLVACSS